MMQCLRRNAGSRTERFGGEPVGEAVGHVAGLGRECGERSVGAVAGAVEPDGAETVGGAAEAVGEGLGDGVTVVRAGERGEGDLAGVGEAVNWKPCLFFHVSLIPLITCHTRVTETVAKRKDRLPFL